MRLHFVNRFYWPAETATGQLLTDLAEGLAAAGWHVSVYTGHSSAGLAPHESRHGVAIHRVGPRMAATQNLVRRALDFASFHFGILPALRRAVRPGDVIVPLTDPPLIGVTATVAARARQAQVVHWVQDIYPEILAAVSGSAVARALSALLRRPRDAAWRRAAGCVTLSGVMAAQIQRSGVPPARIEVIPNWAPRGLGPVAASATAAARQAWGLSDRFVVGYSGNFGRVHDLRRLLEVAARLLSDGRFAFALVGAGAAFEEIRRGAIARRLTNIVFFPPRPRGELAASLSVPDVHLVSVRDGCERLVFPSKLHGIAAAGRPVVLLAHPDSEIAGIVRGEQLGLVFRPDDVTGIAAGLKALANDRAAHAAMSAAAQAYHHRGGGCDAAIARWNRLMHELAVPPSTADCRSGGAKRASLPT